MFKLTLSRQAILFSTIIMALTGCATFQQGAEIDSRIRQQFAQEEAKVESSLEFAKARPEAIWAEGDTAFFSFWQAGIEQERKSQYDTAVTLYRKALDTPRYEMESYDILLPIGRALFLSGKSYEARTQLAKFIKNAEAELAGEVNTMWVASDKAREYIKRNLVFAKWLLHQTR